MLGAPQLCPSCWESWGSHPRDPNPSGQGRVGNLLCERTSPSLPSSSTGHFQPCSWMHFPTRFFFFPSVTGDLSWWEVKPRLFGKGRRGPGRIKGSSKETLGGETGRENIPSQQLLPCPWESANLQDPGDDSWFYSTNPQPWRLWGCQGSCAISGNPEPPGSWILMVIPCRSLPGGADPAVVHSWNSLRTAGILCAARCCLNPPAQKCGSAGCLI